MSNDAAPTRYPGYDVLNKRNTPSWDSITRRVVDARLAIADEPHFFEAHEWATVKALAARIIAQPDDRPTVPLAAMLDQKLYADKGDGWRDARLPKLRDAWRLGLAALDAESRAEHDCAFADLTGSQQDALLTSMQHGDLQGSAWMGMPSDLFFSNRVLHDICTDYYSHPYGWSEIGFGGPANPRGYVRLYKNRRDSWEAIEETPKNAATVRQENARVR